MKTVKQLLRQPLKTLAGLVLMTLAAAVACLCVGQALAAQTTKEDLDKRFTSVAILSLQENLAGKAQLAVEEEMIAWLEEMAQKHPDIVRDVLRNGTLNAYIPQLTPLQGTRSNEVTIWNSTTVYADSHEFNTGVTYFDSAMLVITLEQIGQICAPGDAPADEEKPNINNFESTAAYYQALKKWEKRNELSKADSEFKADAVGYTVELTGTVNQVVSLLDGSRSPVDLTAVVTLVLPTQADIEALNLTVGEQYIVYTQDYNNRYEYFLKYMKDSNYSHISFDPLNPDKWTVPGQDIIDRYAQKNLFVVMLYDSVPLEQWQLDCISVAMTVCQPVNLLQWEAVRDSEGNLIDMVMPNAITGYADTALTAAEFNALYQTPTIAHLEGSVEDFLASDQGAIWREAIRQSEVNNHAFVVMGVNDVHSIPTFALENAQVGEGREFTAEEIASGAKVCMIHEWAAETAGLKIGDTITLSLYATDSRSPYYRGDYLLRPTASAYHAASPMLETAEYTIVGFWKGEQWPDMNPTGRQNYYGFSANTVFVPEKSVQSPLEETASIPFVSVLLENGELDAFRQLMREGGYYGRFKCTDQGYSDIVSNFHNYEQLAMEIMVVGIVVYGILLLLFLMLYPASQQKTVQTMASMGCGFVRRMLHVLLYSLVILAAAAAAGAWLGTSLWDQVVKALQATTESNVALQLELSMLSRIAAAQLALGAVLSTVVAIFVAAPRGIAKRR